MSNIVTLLIEEFLPEMYHKYQFENFQMSEDYRAYNEFVPEYLQGRPPKIIRHCMERKLKGRKFLSDDIEDIDLNGGRFCVKSSSGKEYRVDFGVETRMPSCECKDWIRFNIPCKHFFAIFFQKRNVAMEVTSFQLFAECLPITGC